MRVCQDLMALHTTIFVLIKTNVNSQSDAILDGIYLTIDYLTCKNELKVIIGLKELQRLLMAKGTDKIQSHIKVSTVLADGLAPDGARPSAATVMTQFCLIYMQDCHVNG